MLGLGLGWAGYGVGVELGLGLGLGLGSDCVGVWSCLCLCLVWIGASLGVCKPREPLVGKGAGEGGRRWKDEVGEFEATGVDAYHTLLAICLPKITTLVSEGSAPELA